MLDLQVLSYLIEISRAGSITQAAQNLYISQPHLSSVVKSFEEKIGFSVFRRSAHGAEVTNEGRKFLRMAQEVVDHSLELEQVYLHPNRERLSMSVSVTRSYQILKQLAGFIAENDAFTEINVRFKETNPFRAIEDVASGASDLGVIHYFESQEMTYKSYLLSQKLEAKDFYDREYLLAMSKDNPLADKECVTKEDVKKQLVILYGDYENSWMSYQGIVDMADLVIAPKRMYVYDRGSAYDMLNLHKGSVSWISGLSNDTLEKNGLVMRRCEGVHVRNKGVIIKRSGAELSEHAKKFYELIDSIDWTEIIKE